MKGTLYSLAVAGLLGLAAPTAANAQIVELLQAVDRGGGWITLDVVDGRGRYESGVLPVGGLRLQGCFQVWRGHTGTWRVQAEDRLGDGELDVRTRPGQPVEFDYKAGTRARLDVSVEWSEPRDTTLYMWVGIAGLSGRERDVCQPVSG